MKKALFIAIAIASTVATVAVGDLIGKNEARVANNDDAKSVYTKIVEVTGQDPQKGMYGRVQVTAHANVVCEKAGNSEQYFCKVLVLR